MRTVLKIAINAVALWVTTLVLAPHVTVRSFADDTFADVVSYLAVAALFGIVNGTIGGIVRVVAFPLYILTLGLVALLVNGLLLWLAAWLSSLVGWGLQIDGGFWWGVLAALVLGIASWLLGLLFRPLIKREGRNHR